MLIHRTNYQSMLGHRLDYRLARAALYAISTLFSLALIMLLAGCMSLAAPRSVGDSLAYAEGQVQGLAKSCATLNDERRISLEQAVRCKAVTDQAFVAIDVGRGAYSAGDITRAENQLQLARTLLLEVERITRSQP